MWRSEALTVIVSQQERPGSAALALNAPFGNPGTGLVAQVRQAVRTMRTSGYQPDLLIVDPADAITLDLTTVGADGLYLFGVRDSGSSSPLWDLRVVESVAATGSDPLLVDTQATGTLFLGPLQVAADPFCTNFVKSLTTLRAEARVLMHVRQVAAAYRISV